MSNTPTQRVTSEASNIQQFRLRNQSGFEVMLLNYGATIQSIRVPAPGGFIDAILGYANPVDYLKDAYYIGSTQGRYGNRIENARLNLFNLNRDGSPIDNHHVMINADRFTPLKETMIPTGEKRSVEGGVFDFREPAIISNRLDFENNQIRTGQGFDHNFILNGAPGEIRLAASAWSPQSGLKLNLLTTQPGMQLYTGEHLGHPFLSRGGLCLEAQGFPNAPNTPGFPSTILRPGEIYQQQTIYDFSMEP